MTGLRETRFSNCVLTRQISQFKIWRAFLSKKVDQLIGDQHFLWSMKNHDQLWSIDSMSWSIQNKSLNIINFKCNYFKIYFVSFTIQSSGLCYWFGLAAKFIDRQRYAHNNDGRFSIRRNPINFLTPLNNYQLSALININNNNSIRPILQIL